MGGMTQPSQTQTESLPEGGQRLRNFGFNQMMSNMQNPQMRGPGASMGGPFGQMMGMGMGGGAGGPTGPVPPGPFGFGGGMGMPPPTMGGPGGGMPPTPGGGGMGMRPPGGGMMSQMGGPQSMPWNQPGASGGGMGGLQNMMGQLKGLQGAPAGGAPQIEGGFANMQPGGGGGGVQGGTPFGGMANAGGSSPPMGLPGIPGAPQNTRGPGGGAPAGRNPFGAGAFPQGPVSGSRMAQSFQPSFQNQQFQEPGSADEAARMGADAFEGEGSFFENMRGRSRAGAQAREDFMNPQALGPGSPNPFDLPQFGGPFAAPMNPMQMDALSGFNQAMENNPLVSTDMMRQGLQEGAGGFNTFDPSGGQTLEGRLEPFQTPSGADQFMANLFGGSPFGSQGVQPTEGNPGTLGGLGGEGGAEGGGSGGGSGGSTGGFGEEIIGQLSPDIVSSFRGALNPQTARLGQGRQAMNAAVDRALGVAREEAGGFGLNPGSIDRGQLMAGSAADVAARLGIQQQQADTGALGTMQGNRVGALNAARGLGDFFNTGFQNRLQREGNQLSALPSLLQRENRGFNQFQQTQEPAAQRMMQTLGMLPEFRQQPLNERAQQFGMGEAARGVGDVDLQRQMQEFARAQGGGLQQMIGLLGGVPGINTAFGPSGLSQAGGFLEGVGSLIPGF